MDLPLREEDVVRDRLHRIALSMSAFGQTKLGMDCITRALKDADPESRDALVMFVLDEMTDRINEIYNRTDGTDHPVEYCGMTFERHPEGDA